MDISIIRNLEENYENIDSFISNICMTTNIKNVCINHNVINNTNHIFTKEIHSMKIIDQKRTGTCWICSGITICRNILRKNLKTQDDFNLSINHFMFWDKLEKANYFMDFIIKNYNSKVKLSKIHEKVEEPISDGGYWYMFVDLVNKYGIVPEDINTRKYNATNTNTINELISYKLKEFVLKVYNDNTNNDKLKIEYLGIIKKILTLMFGEPYYPDTEFSWTYKNKDDKKIVLNNMNPIFFYSLW